MSVTSKSAAKKVTKNLPPKKVVKGGLVKTGWTNNHNETLLGAE